jgi:2-polyprenyl-6-methoxyphenol hydroxylase-like FAD-dependent oxidoreductase
MRQKSVLIAGAGIASPALAYWLRQRFQPFIERKQESAEQFASSFTPNTRLGRFVRDLVLRATSISFVSNRLMRHFVAGQFQLPDYPA